MSSETKEIKNDEKIKDSKKGGKKDKRLDLAAKILCVFFAFLLWFYVMIVDSPGDERVIRDVAIQVTEDDRGLLSKGLSVYVDSVETVDVTLSGKRRVLSGISAEDIEVKADLSGITTAGTDISVPLIINAPDGCELVSAERYSIRLSVDSVKKALIPLKAELSGKNPDYIYSETPVFTRIIDGNSVEYTAVVLEGPASMVKNVAAAVVKIDVAGSEMDFTETYAIELVDKDGNPASHAFLKTEFDSINASVTVRMEKTVPLSVNFVQGYFADTDSKVEIVPSEVTVLCAPADAERNDLVPPLEIDEKMVLTEESIRNHSFEVVCYPASPYGTVASSNGVTVTVKIDESIHNRKMNITELHSTNGMDISCVIFDDSIENVVVCGKAEALSNLTPNDIMAVVDLSDYSEDNIGKRYRKKVMFVVDSEYGEQVFIVGDYAVEIFITEK